MRQLVSCAIALAFIGGAAHGQTLTAPADPKQAIEGKWVGQWNGYEAEVRDGVVTLTKADPKSYSNIPVGTVLARLANTGKVEGRLYRFSGSQCLGHSGATTPDRWTFSPCSDFSAVLTTSSTTQELNITGLAFQRKR
jgi:hypothetical protein